MVPVTAELRRGDGDDDHMAGPLGDGLVAPRAAVGLAGLIGLHGPDLQLVRSEHVIHGR
jgi:hypothetical protein